MSRSGQSARLTPTSSEVAEVHTHIRAELGGILANGGAVICASFMAARSSPPMRPN